MASRDVNDLLIEVAALAVLHVESCKERGVDLLIYCTHRDEYEQARIYRTNRPFSVIEQKAAQLAGDPQQRYEVEGRQLLGRGRPDLAGVLLGVGPQTGAKGPRLTNAGPGESYHQHRVAYDCVPLVGGKPLWRWQEGATVAPQWRIVVEIADELQLEWLGRSRTFREAVHFQFPMGLTLREWIARTYGDSDG